MSRLVNWFEHYFTGVWDKVDGILTRLWDGWPRNRGSIFGRDKRVVPSQKCPDRFWPHSSTYRLGTGAFFPMGTRSSRESIVLLTLKKSVGTSICQMKKLLLFDLCVIWMQGAVSEFICIFWVNRVSLESEICSIKKADHKTSHLAARSMRS